MPKDSEFKILAPKDALAYFRQKGLSPSFAWQDVWQDEHAKGFAIAKMVERDQLEHAYEQISRAIGGETNYDTVINELTKRWQADGWWGVQEVTDPLTGKLRTVQLGSQRRAQFIVETNARVANMAGRWNRLWANRKNKPYLIYISRLDGRERPEHRAWHGTILPIDHPWWDSHYPPCGWRCRCRVLAFSARELEARGLKVTEPPKFPLRQYINPRTGEISKVEQGIDPGWSHNVGKSPLRGLVPRDPISSINMQGRPSPAEIKTASETFLKFFNAVDNDRIITDKKEWPITVGPSLFLDASGELSVPRLDLIDRMEDVGKALANPDKAEWVWREAGKGAPLIEDRTQIDVLFQHALKNRSTNNKMRVSASASWLNNVSRAKGFDFFDYTHTLDGAGIRHIINRHGDQKREATLSQIAIDLTDVYRIADIVARPDIVIFGLKHERGGDVVAYIKGDSDGTYVLFDEIRRRRWELNAHSLRKSRKIYSAGDDAKSIVDSLNLNAQSGGRANTSIVDLRGKIKAATPKDYPRTKAQLVRRYTKALDKEIVTVDFSKGTWTFDITPKK
jgi:SPP1 gp7 family putative phage head morphogenesis protein